MRDVKRPGRDQIDGRGVGFIALGQQAVMLKGRRQPGAPQVARIQGLRLIGAVGELDRRDIETLARHATSGVASTAPPWSRSTGSRADRDTDNTGPVFDQTGRRIELLGREAGQLDIAWLLLFRLMLGQWR